MSSSGKYALPQLPCAYDVNSIQALASRKISDFFVGSRTAISAQVMTPHHSKHHQTYVNNLNVAVVSQDIVRAGKKPLLGIDMWEYAIICST